jgi:DNA polymerase elongation subunit (family B)
MNNGILFVCKNETEMLQKFHDVFISWDPDFITGYNLHHEILPFIIHRSKKLNLE